MIKPLHMPSKRGDSFEDHVSVEVHFTNTEEMSDIRHSAEIQFATLKFNVTEKVNCSLFVNGVDEANGQRSYNLRSYIVLPDGTFYSARSSMANLKRADLHLALGELIEDIRVQLKESCQEDCYRSAEVRNASLLPA